MRIISSSSSSSTCHSPLSAVYCYSSFSLELNWKNKRRASEVNLCGRNYYHLVVTNSWVVTKWKLLILLGSRNHFYPIVWVYPRVLGNILCKPLIDPCKYSLVLVLWLPNIEAALVWFIGLFIDLPFSRTATDWSPEGTYENQPPDGLIEWMSNLMF